MKATNESNDRKLVFDPAGESEAQLAVGCGLDAEVRHHIRVEEHESHTEPSAGCENRIVVNPE